MQTTIDVTRVDARALWLCDRLGLLAEIVSIGNALTAIETHFEPTMDTSEIWRRLSAVRASVLAQLRAVDHERIH